MQANVKNQGKVSDFQATSDARKKKYYPSLHWVEVAICTFLWAGGVVGSILTLVPISALNEKRYLKANLLEEGWYSWLGRYQDNSDSEWALWKKYLWEGTVPGFVGHFILARVVERVWPERRFEIFMAYSFAFTTHFLGVQGIVILLLHFGIQYLAVRLTKSVAVCWISGLCLLYTLHAHSSHVIPLYGDDKAYVLLVTVGMSNLRYIGFSLEYAWNCKKKEIKIADNREVQPKRTKKQQDKIVKTNTRSESSKAEITDDCPSDFTFADMLIYQMYFPLFYGGPIINYNEFAKQIKNPPPPWTTARTMRFAGGMLRYLIWHLFTDAALHYVYVSALSYDDKTLNSMGILHLCGFSMAQVGLFYLKYVIMYGLPSFFSLSDGLDVPSQPQCVYSKHRMTDFWKLVDKGLHKWLVRYIYIPCGGSRSGALKAIFSLSVSFAFVIVWHKPTGSHIRWGVLSWFGVFIEFLALEFYRTRAVQTFEKSYLSPQWSRRIRGFFSCFAFGFLIASNMYFLCGVQLGDMLWNRFYFEDLAAAALIHVSLYGAVQSSMNLE